MSFREPSPLGSRLPLFAFLCSSVLAQRSLYQPCPLLGPWVPTPTIDANSPTLRGLSSQLNQQFSNYVAAGDGKYGPITPNTTSFSIALFAAGNRAALSGEKPFFYEYNHAASGPGCAGSTTLDSSAKFPIGDLTQLITVYAQLATLGDKVWAEAVTSYLPDVQARNGNVLKQVQWQDVTLGALAGHMAGITRSCKLNVVAYGPASAYHIQPVRALSTDLAMRTDWSRHSETPYRSSYQTRRPSTPTPHSS